MVLKNTALALRQRFRANSPLVLAAAAVVLVGSGALLFWVASHRRLVAKPLLAGSHFIPADAVMAIALSTEEDPWQRLRQFGSPQSQAQLDQTLARWRDRLLSDHDLSFKADVQPWVGSTVTLALLPSEDAPGEGPAPLPRPEDAANLVMVLPIADGGAAQAILAKRLEPAATPEDYKGISLQTLDANLYGALLGTDTILLATRLSSLKQAIDAAKGGPSLAEKPGFNQAFEPLEDQRSLAQVYVDVPAAALALAANSQPPLATGTDYFQRPRSLAAAIAVAPQGVQIQAVSWFDSSTDNTFSGQNQAGLLPERLPADTLLAVTGGNFQQFWQQFAAGEQLTALLPLQPENLSAGFQAGTGLSLEEDLLPWMAGEFAIDVLAPPDPQGSGQGQDPAAVPNPALVLMVKASDRAAAEQTLQRLGEVMTRRYGYTEDRQTLDESFTTTRWLSADGGTSLSYGWLQDDVLVLAVGDDIMAQLGPRLGRSLAENSLFQLTTGQAPRPNNGHFFINVEAMAKAQESLLLPPLPAEGLISSQAIKALGVTATLLGEREVRYDLFLALPKGNRPGPLPAPAPGEPAAPAPAPEPTPPPGN